jgi:hypothetical protein
MAIGGIVIGSVLLLGRGIPAWHEWTHDAQTSAAELTADATRADALLATYPVIRDSLRVRSTRVVASASLVLNGDTPAAAAATLASLVADAATDAGVTLGAVQPRADASPPLTAPGRHPTQYHGFVPVTVHGDLTGDIVGISQFLGDLERGQTIVSLRDLTISQPDPQAASTRMEMLHAEFTVAGLAIAPKEPAANVRDADHVGATARTEPGGVHG